MYIRGPQGESMSRPPYEVHRAEHNFHYKQQLFMIMETANLLPKVHTCLVMH